MTTSPVTAMMNPDTPNPADSFNEKFEAMQKDFMKKMDQQFLELRKSLISEMEKKIAEQVQAEVEKAIKPIKEQLQSAVKKIENLEMKIKTKEKNNEILEKINNVTISGIPAQPDENLRGIVGTIFSKLGFAQPLAHSSRRFSSGDKSKSIISLKFYSQADKMSFFNEYFKSNRSLILSDVTQKSCDKTRIYINHDLNKEQYQIHKLALKMKRDGKIHNVKIINGQVSIIRNNNNKQPSVITSIEELSNQSA